MIHCQSEDENRPDDCYVINRHPQKYQNWKLEEQNHSGNVAGLLITVSLVSFKTSILIFLISKVRIKAME